MIIRGESIGLIVMLQYFLTITYSTISSIKILCVVVHNLQKNKQMDLYLYGVSDTVLLPYLRGIMHIYGIIHE